MSRLQPERLHRLIERRGLEQCSELLALATPHQLAAVLDLDLWRSPQPGGDACFDVDRFGMWIEALVDAGAEVAASKIAALNITLMTAAFAHHLRVLDLAAVMTYETTDGELASGMRNAVNDTSCELGGYLVVARRAAAWDAMVAVLTTLEEEHGDYFHQLMGGCRRLSNSAPEIDGLDELMGDREQILFDVALDREQRRHEQHYVSPADARAFLQQARTVRLDAPAVPARNPVVGASVSGGDLYSQRSEELAFLANALSAGCSVQGRAFTSQEAMAGASAVCRLGLENWPVQWRERTADVEVSSALIARRFPVDRDLIAAFQVGWTVLHDEVVTHVAERLVQALKDVRTFDPELQLELEALRFELLKETRAGTPWRARRRMETLASLDMLASTALLALIDECPVLHGALGATLPGTGVLAVSASAFDFISSNQQIASVRAFLERLPDLL